MSYPPHGQPFAATTWWVSDPPEDPVSRSGLQFLQWVLADDQRTARAIRLMSAAAVWTVPPVLVVGFIGGQTGWGVMSLVSSALAIGGTVGIRRYRRGRKQVDLDDLRRWVSATERWPLPGGAERHQTAIAVLSPISVTTPAIETAWRGLPGLSASLCR